MCGAAEADAAEVPGETDGDAGGPCGKAVAECGAPTGEHGGEDGGSATCADGGAPAGQGSDEADDQALSPEGAAGDTAAAAADDGALVGEQRRGGEGGEDGEAPGARGGQGAAVRDGDGGGGEGSGGEEEAGGEEKADAGDTENLRIASGSGAAAARLLANGRRVRLLSSGCLGVIVNGGLDLGAAGGSSASSPCRARATGKLEVRLPGGEVLRCDRGRLEPWTRGVQVSSRRDGLHGEVVRVERKPPPEPGPYLVRFEDGTESWRRLAELRFDALRRRGTTLSLQEERREAERCVLSMVPGTWRLERAGGESCILTVAGTPEGKVAGSGKDSRGTLELAGVQTAGGKLTASLSYTGTVGPIPDVKALDGVWEMRCPGAIGKWASVEAGQACMAGREEGAFLRPPGSGRGHYDFVERLGGARRRVVPFGEDLLCWDDGGTWRRLGQDFLGAECAQRVEGKIVFDPPKVCEKSEDDTDKCSIAHMEVTSPGTLCLAFKASTSGPLPDVLKSELRIDGRVVPAVRAKYAASVSKGKRLPNEMKGEMFFDQVSLRQGFEVCFRFGGEYTGFEWAELQPAAPGASSLKGGWRAVESPLRTLHLVGDLTASGNVVTGKVGEGPTVSVTGPTASSVEVETAGQTTTVSLRPYGDEDCANISIRGPALVRFTFFKTEPGYDRMQIAGEEYSGSELPPPHFVSEGEHLQMSWKTDESTTDEGWAFTVRAGVAFARLPGREAEFGACAAPWNNSDSVDAFDGPFVHVPSNPTGKEPFADDELVGSVVVICMSEEDYGAEQGDPDASAPSDAALFEGPLCAPLWHAAAAGARAAVVVLPGCADRGGAVKLAPTEASSESAGDTWPPIPAVAIGASLGQEILEALGAGSPVTAGPSLRHFTLELQSPVEFDGSHNLCRLCLGSPSILRAVLGNEQRRFASSGGDALTALAQHVRLKTGAPPLEEGRLEWLVETAESAVARNQVEELDECLREMLRGLAPVALSPEAVLPHPEPGGADPGRRQIWDFYEKGIRLGAGSFGVVRQAWDRFTGTQVAVKKIKLEPNEHGTLSEEDVVKEFQLLRDLSHPNLLRVVDFFAATGKLYIVTEYAAAHDLTCHIATIAKVDERWIAPVTRQVVSACCFLHRRHIVHHDIKPANVFVTGQHLPAPEEHVPYVLLADFGFAQVEQYVSEEARQERGAGNGTAHYMAPECYRGLSGPKTDAYAVGIMLFEMLSGGGGPDPVSEDGEVSEVDWSLLDHCSEEAIDATKGLIAPDVGIRLSCRDALDLGWFWPPATARDSGPRCAKSLLPPEELSATCAAAFERLARFRELDALCRIARNMLVGQLGREELAAARRAFEALGADRGGVLSEEVLSASLAEHLAANPGSVAVHDLFFAADVHGRGWLEFREFAAAYLVLEELPEGRVHGALEKLFVQLGGSATQAGGVEFGALAERLSCTSGGEVEVLAALFRRYDQCGDGHLSKDDFFSLWGLQPTEGWTLLPAPTAPKALVSILRGSKKDASVLGGAVQAWGFVTFGQPELGRSQGKWYYELEISKCDCPQVGWADRAFDVQDGACDDGVGDDGHSWGVDGVREYKWHNGSSAYDRRWPRPVVVGCALDCSSPASLRFAVDGEWSEVPEFEDLSFQGALYPAASGIEVGTFHFAARECRYAPPDGSYRYLVEEDGIAACLCGEACDVSH